MDKMKKIAQHTLYAFSLFTYSFRHVTLSLTKELLVIFF